MLYLSLVSPQWTRGIHNNRPCELKHDCVSKVKNHINNFPVKISHHSSKTELNIKIMHEHFEKKCLDIAARNQI